MKTLVAYSSLTGNTQKVAQAISDAIPGAEIHPVDKTPNLSDYGLIIVGFWVDRGQPDRKTQEFIERVEGKPVGFFFTLGAYPDSDHAGDVARVTEEMIAKGQNQVLGSFRCQGKVDPALLERMKKSLPADHPHAQMSPQRKARLEEAAKHPNDEDLLRAKAFADDTYRKALSAPAKPNGGGRP
ncbi:MAG: flavodoxin family protein [Deltaproteobacteria bacterium]|nr:flavodoxin family protein [Deltaproteobacteria bacterium]